MKKEIIKSCSLPLFLVLWNQRQGQKTPALHLQMAEWLEQAMEKDKTRLLLMAFRSAGKSTVAGIFAAWLLFRNPDLRILVLAADDALARKMVRNVKRIIERHPLTAHLKPRNADQWATDRFTVRRNLELRDPSMLARGLLANATGSRADIIIYDDVEVPATCDTANKREDLRERLSETAYILSPGGTQLYLGTPHHYCSIYADQPRAEQGEEREFLHGFERLVMPVIDEAGRSLWPERFSPEEIERLKIATGPNRFESQMMLRPVNSAEGRLDPSALKIYNDELDYTRELGTLFIGQKKIVSASAWWDPAFGKSSGDKSVLAIVFADGEGSYYLHHLEYIAVSDRTQDDEATQQCKIVSALAKAHLLPSVTVEINGIGRFLPNILRREMARENVPCSILEVSSTRPKDIRILEAFETLLASRRLFVHRQVLKTPFAMEMREWRPGGKGQDDGLDAVSGALSLQPDRLGRFPRKGGHSWMGKPLSHKADMDFKV
ncbi:MAG: phage terminase large subunit [Alphaproteobacteria bacterium]|nr:phage terminase large subunit [Alphaproteobacteria bacterium]MBP7759327.1 phage terminase large subunit [Alphaproteobacteria bacterium]MBP7762540.1 phage terminase large subunit [Alphaproteobacteria bacterium]MBP7904287.1 phage terminase large subunit [Alphaproteobacteria bacterium]